MFQSSQEMRYQKIMNIGNSVLISMACLTIINMVLIKMNTSILSSFSAFVPTILIGIGDIFGAELDMVLGLLLVLAALLVIGTYLSCFFFGRKKRWGLTVATVLYSIDTLVLGVVGVFLLFLIDELTNMFYSTSFLSGTLKLSIIINIVIHLAVLFFFIWGMVAAFKLRKIQRTESYYPPPPVYDTGYGAPGAYASPGYSPSHGETFYDYQQPSYGGAWDTPPDTIYELPPANPFAESVPDPATPGFESIDFHTPQIIRSFTPDVSPEQGIRSSVPLEESPKPEGPQAPETIDLAQPAGMNTNRASDLSFWAAPSVTSDIDTDIADLERMLEEM